MSTGANSRGAYADGVVKTACGAAPDARVGQLLRRAARSRRGRAGRWSSPCGGARPDQDGRPGRPAGSISGSSWEAISRPRSSTAAAKRFSGIERFWRNSAIFGSGTGVVMGGEGSRSGRPGKPPAPKSPICEGNTRENGRFFLFGLRQAPNPEKVIRGAQRSCVPSRRNSLGSAGNHEAGPPFLFGAAGTTAPLAPKPPPLPPNIAGPVDRSTGPACRRAGERRYFD